MCDRLGRRTEARVSTKEPKHAEGILAGTIQIGWTRELVAESWGVPKHVNRTVNAYGAKEQWVYGSCRYAYFEDGILTIFKTCQ